MAVELTPNGTRGTTRTSNPFLRALFDLNRGLYRLLRGRGMSRSLLLLTTVGARSGEERTTPLVYFRDGEGAWLIIASSGGAARHPDWYVNLARNPDRVWIEIGDRRIRVRPESLKGAEREDRWRRITARARQFAGYQSETDREIPVVRLSAVE
jgi:deazaflavin-dependent oxidoreductase (nitroreductase family)